MSNEPTRADLRVQYMHDQTDSYTAPPYKAYRWLTDAEFDRIVQDEGYIKVTDVCETCGGYGKLHRPLEQRPPRRDPCPDCTDGRVLREGVTPHTWSAMDKCWRFYSFPAEWLGASDGE